MSVRLCDKLRKTCACELPLARCYSSSCDVPSPQDRIDGPVKRSWAPGNYVRPPRVDDMPLGDIGYGRQRNREAPFAKQKRSQHQLKGDIDKIFSDRNLCDEFLFTKFIKDGLQLCNTSNVARFARLTGKKSRGQSNALLKQYLPELAARIRVLPFSSWRFTDVSFVIYGLQTLDANDDGYLDIVSATTRVGAIVISGTDLLPSQNLSMMLYGLQKNKCTDFESLSLLEVITQMVPKCEEPLDAQAVGNALYGLQSMSSGSDEVRGLVSALVERVESCTESLSAQAVGNALYGLQGMSSDSEEVRALVSALVSKVEGCREPFSAQTVGNALYGLQGMSVESGVTRAMVTALVSKVQGCKESLNAQEVGNALYGLKCMRSDVAQVRSLLSVLVPKVQGCKMSLDAQAVGNALYGLQGMSSDVAQVRSLISALVPKVQSCKGSFSAQNVSNALYGLQAMSSDSKEVRALVLALVAKVQCCEESLDAQAVGNALYGLQGMSSDSVEVCELLSALVVKVQSCEESLSVRNVGDALFGLKGVLGSISSLDVLLVIASNIRKIANNSAQFHSLSNADIVHLGQSVAISLPALRDSLNHDEYFEWEKISQLLDVALTSRPCITGGAIRSDTERQLYSLSVRALGKSGVDLSRNEYLFNLFESDIVLRIPRVGGDCLIVNIEVDGTYHLLERKKRFCALRDEYLKSKGVVVERVEVSRLMGMKDIDIEKWVLERVAAASSNKFE